MDPHAPGGRPKVAPTGASLDAARAATAQTRAARCGGSFRQAALPEFEGNVAFVGTRAFWRPAKESPTGQGYHWNTNAETYYLIGEALAEAMKHLTSAPAGCRPDSSPGGWR